MQEVACFHCRNIVIITPDAERCSFCGEDLKHLLLPESVSDYFYQRASERAAAGDPASGLVEVERGLSYRSSSELHLLAAILAQHVGRYDQMRLHVAAIPVDDGLRPEAEWLLRSHQARQRALREGSKQERGPGTDGAANWLESLLNREPPGSRAQAKRAAKRPIFWQLAPIPLAAALLFLTWFWFVQPGLATLLRGDENTQGEIKGTPVVGGPEDSAEAAGGTPQSAEGTAEDAMEVTPTPTESIPEDLVLRPTDSPEIADSSPRTAVVVRMAVFDLKTFLRNAGHTELAALPVDARLQEGKLILQGVVNLDVQRRTLIEVVNTVPGVREVSAVDLLLRPLPTYTVQEGDTLWNIVYNIYGNVDRVEEFIAYNVDVLPSPDALTVGTVLKVPLFETP
jgi:hypothetical protein